MGDCLLGCQKHHKMSFVVTQIQNKAECNEKAHDDREPLNNKHLFSSL